MMAAQPNFTEDARSDLRRYLRRVRAALRPHPSVDAAEVELDIRGHIEAELAGEPEPVTAERLHGVLDRLGSPNDWVPEDELPAWRRMLLRFNTGPEDWRLAYLSLGLFIACWVLAPVGPLLLLASFLVARAGLRVLEQQGESAGPRKWFFYPPLLFVYFCIVAVAALLPMAVGVGVATEELILLPVPAGGPPVLIAELTWLAAILQVVLVIGACWLVIGLLMAWLTGAVRAVFWPFAEQLRKRHCLRIAWVGGGAAVLAGITLVLAT